MTTPLPATPPLFKVLESFRDRAGVNWYPVAAWALDGQSEDPLVGYPWQLETTLILGAFQTSNAWEYLALSCHLVTGLEDRYEHTFDAWDRKDGDEERHSWVEIMVPVDYQVEAVAAALATDADTADQFLMYRTLHSCLPGPLLKWFAAGNDGPRGAGPDWESFASAAGQMLEGEYAGIFGSPAPCVPFCDVSPDLEVRLHGGASPVQHPPTGNLFDYALTANLLPWTDLFAEEVPGRLTFRSGATTVLRAAMESDDATRRIGTFDGGRNSDSALRLLLRARLMNLVAPVALWARLGVWGGDAPDGEWRLQLPETMRLGWASPAGSSG